MPPEGRYLKFTLLNKSKRMILLQRYFYQYIRNPYHTYPRKIRYFLDESLKYDSGS